MFGRNPKGIIFLNNGEFTNIISHLNRSRNELNKAIDDFKHNSSKSRNFQKLSLDNNITQK